MRELKQENSRLRREFAKLNEFITQLVEAKRKEAAKRKPVSGILHIAPTSEETKNAEKQLAAAENEFQQLRSRLEQVSDPLYVNELKEHMLALAQRIRRADRNRRALTLEQLQRGKELNRAAEPARASVEKEELDSVHTKVQGLEAVLQKNAVVMQEKTARLGQEKARWHKLDEEARGMGILESEKEGPEANYDRLMTIKTMIEKGINSIRTKRTVSAHDYAGEISELQTRLTGLTEMLHQKNEYVLPR